MDLFQTSKKTPVSKDDLIKTLDDKFDTPAGTTSEYVRGDGTLATFPTTSSVGFEQNFLLMGA